MTVAEEHAAIRQFLRRLGSGYQYTSDIITTEYQHQPVRIVIGRMTKAAPTLRREADPTPRPSALAFALAGANVAEIPAPQPRPEPLPAAPRVESEPLRSYQPIATTSEPTVKPSGLSNIAALLAADVPQHRVTGVVTRETTLAVFLGSAPPPITKTEWKAQPPPEFLPDDIILNFETNGLDWAGNDEPIGVTVGTHDGFYRYLPWGHREGNLDQEAVIRFLKSLRNKKIKNANTRFDVHMGRKIGVDFEAQGCTVSDIMHTAALLDDHRKRFALDVLAKDYLGGVEVERVDERNMADYAAADVARRAEYQTELVAKLHAVMWPQIVEQDLERVHKIEDDVIYPVVEMEKNGSLIDVELLDQFHRECTDRHKELMMEISRECGFPFEHTAAGWKRLLEHLSLQIPDSYSEDVLNGYEHPLVKKGQRAAQYASLNSKTFAAYRNAIDSNGILRYDINQLRGDSGGTVTGRFSIGLVQQVPNHDNHHSAFGEGDVDGCKGACDLFPRRLFKAAIGQALEADAMQIEFRLFANLANNEELLQGYRDDPLMNFHKKMWAMVKRYKPDMLYSHQKNYDFAFQYGAKVIKLATMLGFITAKDADEIRGRKLWNDPRLDQIKEIDAAFCRAVPEVSHLLDKASHLLKPYCDKYCRTYDSLHKQFKHRGYVKTIAGRRGRSPDGYKSYIGLNKVLQGSGADVMKVKLAELHRARKETAFLMRLTVHDAVGGDAQTPETEGLVKEILNSQSFPEMKVPILWSVGTGRSWADCK